MFGSEEEPGLTVVRRGRACYTGHASEAGIFVSLVHIDSRRNGGVIDLFGEQEHPLCWTMLGYAVYSEASNVFPVHTNSILPCLK